MTTGEPVNRYPWRVVSLAEHEQPALAVVRCQPKDFRASRVAGLWPVRLDATRYYLASIFDTLLSSQGSDAHQRFAHRARRRGWYPCCSPCGGATVLTYPRPCLGVKSVIRCVSGRTGSRLDLCGAPTLAPWGAGSNSVSVATEVVVVPCLGVGSARGTGLLGAGWRPIRLASVPPSRADVENIR